MVIDKFCTAQFRKARKSGRIAPFATGVLLTATVLNGPVIAADADRGFELAARWCNGCHSIGDDPQRQEDAGTPFAELAKNDEIYLQSAINHPHEFMPDFPQLTDTDKGDLIAYIRSLGG